MEIRDNMNAATDLINQAEALRSQLAHEGDLGQDDAVAKAAKAKAADLDKKILAIESKLFNMTSTGRGQDQLRLPKSAGREAVSPCRCGLVERFPADRPGARPFTRN